MNVTVKLDATDVRKRLEHLSEAVSNRAIVRSLNRAVAASNTEAGRVVREELNLKLADVKDVISVRKASSQGLTASLVISPKPAPLIDFAARQTAKGVTVKVKRQGGRVLVRNAFIAKMKSGHVGVFTRGLLGGGYSKRLPIRELFSTSVRQLFKRASAVKRVTVRAAEAFNAAAVNQIKQALKGK